MLRLLADENLNAYIVRGLRRRLDGLGLATVQSLGLAGADDPAVLQVAAEQGRVLVTQDVLTMTRFAFERVDAGLSMPGVIEIVAGAALGVVARASSPGSVRPGWPDYAGERCSGRSYDQGPIVHERELLERHLDN
jgi:hypothetical protein